MLNVWNKYLWNKQTLNKSFSFQTYLLVTLLEKIKFCKENGKLFKTGKNSGCLVITWNFFCIQQPTTSGCDNQLVTKKLYSNTHQLLGNLAIESQVSKSPSGRQSVWWPWEVKCNATKKNTPANRKKLQKNTKGMCFWCDNNVTDQLWQW